MKKQLLIFCIVALSSISLSFVYSRRQQHEEAQSRATYAFTQNTPAGRYIFVKIHDGVATNLITHDTTATGLTTVSGELNVAGSVHSTNFVGGSFTGDGFGLSNLNIVARGLATTNYVDFGDTSVSNYVDYSINFLINNINAVSNDFYMALLTEGNSRIQGDLAGSNYVDFAVGFLTNAINTINHNTGVINDSIFTINDRIEQLSEVELSSINSKVSNNSNRINQVVSELTASTERIDTLESDLSLSNDRIDTLESDLSLSNDRIDTNISNIANNSNRIDVLNSNVSSLSSALSDYATKDWSLSSFKQLNTTDPELLRLYHYGSLDIVESPAEWFTFSDGTITKFNYEVGRESVVIPWEIGGVPVTAIDDMAFNAVSIESLVGPKTLTSIGPKAFYNCSSLTSVSLPSATSIGGYAFNACYNLTSISLPSVTSIGYSAFDSCSSLTSISLPLATSIGNWTFHGCNSLTSVSLPSATSIGSYAFNSCKSLTSVSVPLATSIGFSAFNICYNLTSVSLPSATSIGGSAFRYCNSLITVYFGTAKPTEGSSMFDNVPSNQVTIYAIESPDWSGVTTWGGMPVVQVDNYENILATKHWVEDQDYLQQTDLAGYDNRIDTLESDLSSSNNRIDTNISNIANNSNRVDTLESDLNTLNGLSNNRIDTNISNIANNSNRIDTLNSNVSSLGSALSDYATKDWSLSSFKQLNTTDPEVLRLYHYDSMDIVESPVEWFTFSNGTITKFNYEVGRENVVIPWEIGGVPVTAIGDRAFIDENSYSGFPIESLIGPKTLISIGSSAFQNCNNLTSVSLPSATSIVNQAFMNCNLTSVSLPLVTSVGDRVFYNCDSLTSVNLPSATSVGDDAFQTCNNLTSVNLPLVTSIRRSAFQNCNNLTSVSLPLATSIGDYAFNLCSSLTTISLPLATSVGGCAFYGCANLTTVYFGTAKPTEGSSMFGNVPSNQVTIYAIESPAWFEVTTWGGMPVVTVEDFELITTIVGVQAYAEAVSNKFDSAVYVLETDLNTKVSTNHTGNVSIHGGITADTFIGDGSQLSGVSGGVEFPELTIGSSPTTTTVHFSKDYKYYHILATNTTDVVFDYAGIGDFTGSVLEYQIRLTLVNPLVDAVTIPADGVAGIKYVGDIDITATITNTVQYLGMMVYSTNNVLLSHWFFDEP